MYTHPFLACQEVESAGELSLFWFAKPQAELGAGSWRKRDCTPAIVARRDSDAAPWLVEGAEPVCAKPQAAGTLGRERRSCYLLSRKAFQLR